MTGQDAVNVKQLNLIQKVGIDGVIVTRLDGDTRGWCSVIKVKAVTGKPIPLCRYG